MRSSQSRQKMLEPFLIALLLTSAAVAQSGGAPPVGRSTSAAGHSGSGAIRAESLLTNDQDSAGTDTASFNEDRVGKKRPGWIWSLTLRNRTGWRTNGPRTVQMSRNYLELKGQYRIDPTWSLTLEGRAHYDPVGRLGYPTRLWLDPRQALLDGRVGKVDLKLGLQQVVWGAADGLRILDVINPLDYREFILEDFLDSRRPLCMARADVPLGPGSLQLILVPYFESGRIPVGNDEFAAGLLVTGHRATMPTGGGVFVPRNEVRPTNLPGGRSLSLNIGNWQGGARYRQSLGSWDLTVNYFKGWEDLPTPYISGIGAGADGGTTLVISPRHVRKEVVGGTATNSIGPVVLRFEAGIARGVPIVDNRSQDPSGFVNGLRLSGVVGIDYSALPWLWVSGQYFIQSSLVTGPAKTSAAMFGGVAAPPLQSHLASIYLRTNFRRETLRPELFILTGLNESQYLIRPRLTKSLGDHWVVGVGWDLLGGAPRNIFGYFGTRDRAVVELKWIW